MKNMWSLTIRTGMAALFTADRMREWMVGGGGTREAGVISQPLWELSTHENPFSTTEQM